MEVEVAPHPGVIIKDELEVRNLKQKDFAEEIQVAYSQFNEIINGKRSITADFAILLEAALGIEALFWLNLQSIYDLEKTKAKSHKPITTYLESWNKIRECIPYSYFKKHNIITGDVVKDEERIKEIYRISSIDDLTQKVCSAESAKYKKTETRAVNKINLAGWLNLVNYYARENKRDINSFDPKKKDLLLSKLKSVLSGTHVVKNSTKVLNEFGIKLIIQEKPEQTPVDGVAFWSEKHPAIGLTKRYNRLDNFAFTLFHELGHIFLHSDKIKGHEITIDRVDDLDNYNYNRRNKEEIEANEFASNHLIPKEAWENFNMKYFEFTDESILEFANEVKIHPAIVVGRLRFENPILYKRRFRISNELD